MLRQRTSWDLIWLALSGYSAWPCHEWNLTYRRLALCHNSKRPRCPNQLKINRIPLHLLDCHPEYQLKTRWNVWQPCGTSRENRRSQWQLDRKPDTNFPAREESGIACLHRRRDLTPLFKLYRNPEIYICTGEETWGSGINSRGEPWPPHWMERNSERPLRTGMEAWLSWGNTSWSLRSPS